MATANSPFSISLAGVTLTQPAGAIIAGSLNFHDEISQRSEVTITVWTDPSAGGVYSWAFGTPVIIRDATSALLFSGFVMDDAVTKPGFSARLLHSLTINDNHCLADKRLFAGSFLGDTAGQMVQAIWQQTLAQEGVTLSPATIGAGSLISEAKWNYEQVSTIFDQLASQSNYWWNIDKNRVLSFLPYGAVAAPFLLDGTQVDQMSSLKVEFGNRQYRNRQYTIGATDRTGLLTETFVGNGASVAFTLRYEISSVKSVSVNGVAQSLGVKGVDNGKPFYYAVGDAVIAQDPANPPLTGAQTLSVTYTGRYPVVGLAQSNSLIIAQQSLEGLGTGFVETKYTDTKLTTLGAAFNVAQALLQHYGSSMTTLSFRTQMTGLAPGQLLSVNLACFNLNESMLVRSIDTTDADEGYQVWYHVVCVGSPYDVTWQTFFNNLLNQGQATVDLVDQSISSTLATLQQWSSAWNWTATRILTIYSCPLCGNSTLCGASLICC